MAKLVCAVFLALLPAACAPGGSAPQPQAVAHPTPSPVVQPVDDGNGVLYFPAAGEQYRRSLAAFYAKNPGMHCDLQGVTQDTRDEGVFDQRVVYMPITGFILHCHDFAVNAQDETYP